MLRRLAFASLVMPFQASGIETTVNWQVSMVTSNRSLIPGWSQLAAFPATNMVAALYDGRYDGTNHHALVLAVGRRDTWTVYDVPGSGHTDTASAPAGRPGLAISSNALVYVAWYTTNGVFVACNSNGTWAIDQVATNREGYTGCSVDVNPSNDEPAVVYCANTADSSTDLVLFKQRSTSGVWSDAETVASGFANKNYPDLVFDPLTHDACVAYSESLGTARFARRTSPGVWARQSVGKPGDSSYHTVLAFNPTSFFPAVAYAVSPFKDPVHFAEWQGTNWSITTTPTAFPIKDQFGLAYKPNGQPVIAMCAYTNYYKTIYVFERSETNWIEWSHFDVNASAGDSVALVLEDNTPVVSYQAGGDFFCAMQAIAFTSIVINTNDVHFSVCGLQPYTRCVLQTVTELQGSSWTNRASFVATSSSTNLIDKLPDQIRSFYRIKEE